ncbi:MAG: glycoside hydrolase domain-containing protein, partial [Planctomycetota bacterium]
EPFDPMDKLGFAEGNAWQYTWYVPHDPAGLARHLGGVERTLDQLERCFELAEPTGFIAPHGQHHASTLDFGNQPSTHIAHLFHHLGRPDRTDHWLDRVFAAAKSGTTVHDGYGGDEDQGLMAAWNVLVQLGLFNTTGLAARNPTWQRTRPHFRQVRIHRPNADEPIHLDADTTTREITHNTLVDERA